MLKLLSRIFLVGITLSGLLITPSNAATITYTGTNNINIDADDVSQVPLFDPSLGTLNSVQINYDLETHTVIGYTLPISETDEFHVTIDAIFEAGFEYGQVRYEGNVSIGHTDFVSEVLTLNANFPASSNEPKSYDLNFILDSFISETINGLDTTGFLLPPPSPFVTPIAYLMPQAYFSACESPTQGVQVDYCAIRQFGGSWDITYDYTPGDISVIPVPAAVWLFSAALIGLVGLSKRRKAV